MLTPKGKRFVGTLMVIGLAATFPQFAWALMIFAAARIVTRNVVVVRFVKE